MTYPGGAPGGYPGPQQPPTQTYGQPPQAGGGIKLSLPQILNLTTAGVGALILFIGFVPLARSSSFYEAGAGWVPALYLISGLLVAPAFLPGDKKVGLNAATVSVGVTLAFLFTIFSVSSLGAGGIIVLLLGLVHTGAAVFAALLEAGIVKAPTPAPAGHFGQPGGYNPPSAPFQAQQPAQPYAAPQQPYAPPPGQFGQPPATPPGGYPQQ